MRRLETRAWRNTRPATTHCRAAAAAAVATHNRGWPGRHFGDVRPAGGALPVGMSASLGAPPSLPCRQDRAVLHARILHAEPPHVGAQR